MKPRVGERTAWIAFGANQGNRRACFEEALRLLGRHGVRIEARSRCYRAEPVGVEGPWYLNAVVRVRSPWGPRELLRRCAVIERSLGRRSKGDGAPRPADLDLLVYEDLVGGGDDLILPHPRLAQRRFVLVPLAELDPELEVPGTGATVSRLLADCGDPHAIEALEEATP